MALTWAAGAGSLALFGAFLWSDSLPGLDLRLSDHSLLLWDSSLCLLFFAQHSILVLRSVRNALRRVMPEHCHGVAYTFTSAVALVALVLLWQHSAENFYALAGLGRWVLRALLLLAFVGVLWGIRSLDRFDAFGIEAYLAHVRGQQLPSGGLIVKGPYRLVRHPFYAFAIIAVWATPVLSVDRLLLNVLFTAWIVLGANLEEHDLMATFGEDYARYRRTVPMFLPGLSRRRGPVEEMNAASGNRAA